VERVYSPLVVSITAKSRGDVRRSKLYYLRDRYGKAARIRKKIISKVSKKSDGKNDIAKAIDEN